MKKLILILLLRYLIPIINQRNKKQYISVLIGVLLPILSISKSFGAWPGECYVIKKEIYNTQKIISDKPVRFWNDGPFFDESTGLLTKPDSVWEVCQNETFYWVQYHAYYWDGHLNRWILGGETHGWWLTDSPENFATVSELPAGCESDCTEDDDGDGTVNCNDLCPDDPNKTEPGECGCNTLDTDTDGDDTPDCKDKCPTDPNKTEYGECGCLKPDIYNEETKTFDCMRDEGLGKPSPCP